MKMNWNLTPAQLAERNAMADGALALIQEDSQIKARDIKRAVGASKQQWADIVWLIGHGAAVRNHVPVWYNQRSHSWVFAKGNAAKVAALADVFMGIGQDIERARQQFERPDLETNPAITLIFNGLETAIAGNRKTFEGVAQLIDGPVRQALEAASISE
jgi:hypothetical protein